MVGFLDFEEQENFFIRPASLEACPKPVINWIYIYIFFFFWGGGGGGVFKWPSTLLLFREFEKVAKLKKSVEKICWRMSAAFQSVLELTIYGKSLSCWINGNRFTTAKYGYFRR